MRGTTMFSTGSSSVMDTSVIHTMRVAPCPWCCRWSPMLVAPGWFSGLEHGGFQFLTPLRNAAMDSSCANILHSSDFLWKFLGVEFLHWRA